MLTIYIYIYICTGHQSAGVFHAVYYISGKADGQKAGAYHNQHKAHRNHKATGRKWWRCPSNWFISRYERSQCQCLCLHQLYLSTSYSASSLQSCSSPAYTSELWWQSMVDDRFIVDGADYFCGASWFHQWIPHPLSQHQKLPVTSHLCNRHSLH